MRSGAEPVAAPGVTAWPVVGGDHEPRLLDYLRVLRRHWLLIAATVALAMGGALAYLWLAPPLYQGTVRLHVQANPPTYVPALEDIESARNVDTFFNTQMDILRSRTVAATVVERLTPTERSELLDPPRFGAPLTGLRERLLGDGPRAADPEAPEPDSPRAERILVNRVRAGIEIFRHRDSEVLDIRFEAGDAELAARIANLVGDAYVTTQERQRLAVSDRVGEWLNAQLERLQDKLSESERALQAFKEEQGLLASEEMAALGGQRLSAVNQDLLAARTRRMEAQVLHEQVQAADGVEALAAILDDPVVRSLGLDQAQLEAELERLRSHYGPRAQPVQSLRAQLGSTTNRLRAEIDRAVAAVRKRYEEAVQTERSLEQAAEEMNAGLRALGDEALELARREREVQTNRELHQAFRNRIKEIGLAGTMGATGIRILDPALRPEAPYRPDSVRVLGLAGLLGSALAVGLAFLSENLRRTFHTPAAVEQQLALPGLGVVPRFQRQAGGSGRRILRDADSPFVEALGGLRTRLEAIGGDGASGIVLVTSALPGEGKTTLSANLASSYSQLGPTLLIDADLRRPSLSSAWQGPGFTDLIRGRATLEQCVGEDGVVPNLFLMGKGREAVHPLELFGGAELAAAFGRLRRHFPHIIVDSAPVLSVSDAEMLGRCVDGVVLAVKAGRTPMDTVAEAAQRLRRARVPVLGVALTQADLREVARYGGYAYGVY